MAITCPPGNGSYVLRKPRSTVMPRTSRTLSCPPRTEKPQSHDSRSGLSRLTTDEQAWRLTGRKPANDAVLRLNVDLIRSLVPEPSEPPTPHLEVEWEPRFVENEHGIRILDAEPGSAGHAGIRYLRYGQSAQRTSLRVQLAENAVVRRLPELLLDEGAAPVKQ